MKKIMHSKQISEARLAPIAGMLFALLALGGLLFGLSGCGQPGQPSASIDVSTVPADAVVVCDGVNYGSAPITISGLSAGQHLLVVSKEGYREERVTVNLFEGQRSSQRIELQPVTGIVLIESTPPGADVTIDKAHKGRTPLLVHDLPIGNYRVNLFLESYFPRELSLRIKDRVPQHITAELTSDSASLNIQSQPSGAAVTVDGASMGRTPCSIERIKSGTATIEIALEGYLPHQQEVRLRAGEQYDVRTELVPLPSGLTVYSVPDKARVYVGGEFRGETPLTLSNLSVGSYRIRVDKDGFESQERSVDLGPGARRIEEFRLNSNSGRIVLVTEPARVKVFLDGDLVGETEAQDNEIISAPLEIDLVSEGSHRLQLVRQGYFYEPRSIQIGRNQVLTLHEQMQRLFIPDTLVRTGQGSAGTYRGILLRRHPNGDIDLETRPGIIVTIPAGEIQSVSALDPRETRQ
jgi:hypothetical protein